MGTMEITLSSCFMDVKCCGYVINDSPKGHVLVQKLKVNSVCKIEGELPVLIQAELGV